MSTFLRLIWRRDVDDDDNDVEGQSRVSRQEVPPGYSRRTWGPGRARGRGCPFKWGNLKGWGFEKGQNVKFVYQGQEISCVCIRLVFFLSICSALNYSAIVDH